MPLVMDDVKVATREGVEVYQHPGLSQPGYGLLELSAACRGGCGRAAPPRPAGCVGGAGAKLLQAVPLELCGVASGPSA